ncbi:MAG: carboxylate--amine ligase [Rubrobacter sp.]|nr:carboxylate--amine ligase [Rubrobacter sp.]
MARVQIGGAGGAPSNNFIRSLRDSRRGDYLIGTSSVPSDLLLADTDQGHVVPYATDPEYPRALLRLLEETRPDLLHLQNDFEVLAVSRIRDQVEDLGVKLFLPAPETVENCVDKYRSYEIWRKAGVRVPETILLHSPEDLALAFEKLGPKVWLRATEGGGGSGALPADDFDFARLWVDRFEGWGEFTAAECLTAGTVTWLSIWHEGRLVVGQTRRRRSWKFGSRTLSGVTGITGIGETCSDPLVDRVAQEAILAVDAEPHGIFGVDMAYDLEGYPNPTEINIGRFFTTHYFFTRAGLNMPEVYCDLALEGRLPDLKRKVNPLPDGLVWLRGMDIAPVLTTAEELERELEQRVP